MQLEVFSRIEASVLTEVFLSRLLECWGAVADQLQVIGVGEIAHFSEMEITLLDDSEMARIHGEFLDDPTPTDVITFDHGELLIGVETAARQAKEFESSQAREIALYGIHGMLHLSGFDDRSSDDAKLMAARQFELLAQFFPEF